MFQPAPGRKSLEVESLFVVEGLEPRIVRSVRYEGESNHEKDEKGARGRDGADRVHIAVRRRGDRHRGHRRRRERLRVGARGDPGNDVRQRIAVQVLGLRQPELPEPAGELRGRWRLLGLRDLQRPGGNPRRRQPERPAGRLHHPIQGRVRLAAGERRRPRAFPCVP